MLHVPAHFNTLLLLLPLLASAEECTESRYDMWLKEVEPGHRAFLVSHDAEEQSMTCLAKGSGFKDEILDPAVSSHTNIATFRQYSSMPCKVFQDRFDKPDISPLEKPGPVKKKKRLLQETDSSCTTLGGSPKCSYPKELELANNWGGVSFKISRVNYKHTTESETTPGVAYQNAGKDDNLPPNKISRVTAHSPVFGSTGKACQLKGTGSQHFYTSGVVFEGSPLPTDMKYKVYAFASEEERQLALADTRNEGLQYAQKMKGENGCDIEIVYEFFPQSGGGLMVEMSQTMGNMNAPDSDPIHKITDSTSAYTIQDEHIGIVQVDSAAIRANQYLPHRKGCDDGQTTTIKFSTQFICKKTGKRVDITSFKMSRTSATNGKVMAELSTDANSPTTFQMDPKNPTDCYRKKDCDGDQFEPDFVLVMSPEAAPESCGSFYWDPLLHSVSGDGRSASAAAKEEGLENSARSKYAGSKGVALLLATGVIVIAGWTGF